MESPLWARLEERKAWHLCPPATPSMGETELEAAGQERCPCHLECSGHSPGFSLPDSCQPLGRAWAGQSAGSLVKSTLSVGAAHSNFPLAELEQPKCQAIAGDGSTEPATEDGPWEEAAHGPYNLLVQD